MDKLKIVKGNTFETVVEIRAYKYNGEEITDFDLNNCTNISIINHVSKGTLYYFKLFVEGTLVRDMVPCIDPNNVVGLYDLVNNVFYSSPNGSAFVAGPTV